MAITYKSQGSGVATETSGAALSPLCPAVVDAGDILIAHVFWEGTTTAPSTPANWTLLSGPHVIETTIARHWVFGKIADGTEDGSAVAFGNPAVTTQRAARIYSFAGRTAGTITELVTGFAHISNALDPTFPTVTTTIAGALAVALVAQNDNNTLASPTGETGGDWTEAVAEFSANLTPGLSLGICTATPTADPGTITGGTDNTTNDPVGVVGFQIKQNANISVGVGVGQVIATGFEPTVTVGANQTVTPGVGQVIATGFIPTVSVTDNKTVTPGTGQVDANGFAPLVIIGINVSPGVGQVIATGFEPTVSISDHKTVTPGLGELLVTGFEPTVSVSNNIVVSPALGSVVVSGFEPTIITPVTVTPALGELIVTGYEPTVTVSDHKVVTPGTGQVIVNGFEPSVGGGTLVSIGLGEVIATGFEPIVSVSNNIIITTGLGQVIATGFEPTVLIELGGPALVETATGMAIVTGYAPLVTISRRQFVVRKSRIGGEGIMSDIGLANVKSKIENGI